MALHEADLDLEEAVLHIRRDLQVVAAELRAGYADAGELIEGRFRYCDVKTHQETHPPAARVRRRRAPPAPMREERLANARVYVDMGLLFRRPDGTHLRPEYVQRHLERATTTSAAKAAGVTRMTPHMLRHEFVSLLLFAGVDPRTIMEIAGHSTMAITTDVYGHPLAKAVRDARHQTRRPPRRSSMKKAPVHPRRGSRARSAHAESARTALHAVGLVGGACRCRVVEISVDGGRWFALFSVDGIEHERRQRAGSGAVTETGLLHALWALPEDMPVPLRSLADREAATLLKGGRSHIQHQGDNLTRRYRSAGTITAVAAVAARSPDAVRRVGKLPPIYRRLAVTIGPQPDEPDALTQAQSLGIGLVSVSRSCGPTVQLQPSPPMLGTPGVYRWYVAELAYRNWLQANCAHCRS